MSVPGSLENKGSNGMPPRRLHVAIDAQVAPGLAGGVAQAILSLVHGLGALHDGAEVYTIVVRSREQLDWYRAVAGPNQTVVLKEAAPQARRRVQMLRAFAPLRPAARAVRALMNFHSGLWPEVPVSDGYYEALGCDVLHLPHPNFTLCAVPTIYNPHDLQHLHYPQFTTAERIAWREVIYPAGCRLAQTVVVGSSWVKQDIVEQYRVHAPKIQVIPEAPVTLLYPEPSAEDLDRVRALYGLDGPFALYPAVPWPHKNHLALFEALAVLRDRHGLVVRLVCPGARWEPFWPKIEASLATLGLRSQVRFTGFVPERDLRALYRLAQFLVQPSLFEASSLPIFDAWLEGLPVACSSATALPEQVMEAALLFDPRDIEAIADAVARLATDAALREELVRRGRQRLADFDPERTAKAYRAVYRRAAGRALSDEDHHLLAWDWMREPMPARS